MFPGERRGPAAQAERLGPAFAGEQEGISQDSNKKPAGEEHHSPRPRHVSRRRIHLAPEAAGDE